MGDNRKTTGARKPKRPRRAPKRAAGAPPEPEGLLERALRYKRPAGYALLAMGATFAAAMTLLLAVYGPSHAPEGPAPTVEIDWPAEISSEDAADKLAAAGLVSNAEAMAMFLRATGGTSEFAAGPHLLPMGATPWELRKLLSRSMFRPRAKVAVPEGFSRFDIAARLEKLRVASKRSFVAASADAKLLAELGLDKDGTTDSAEGYLFPATYDLPLDSDPREVVRALVAATNKRWASIAAQHEAGVAELKKTLGWGRREVLTLASIVEKEAVVDDERPLIASVFFNRLNDASFRSHKLQSDPTSNYGCVAFPAEAPTCSGFTGKATPANLHDPKNRYSTYVHAGLPPGPIANPSVKSIDAVLAPASTRFLYFVATGGSRHTFSETFGAHNEAVRGGKSP